MEETDDAATSIAFPADRLFNLLIRAPYKPLGALWEKAVERIDVDPSGSLTASKSLIEATCKTILIQTNNSIPRNADLPTLYNLASKALSMAAVQQSKQSYKALFGAVHTIVQSVGELRNLSGDAHGCQCHLYSSSAAEAELAVNLTGTVCLYLISTLESFLMLSQRTGSRGELYLRFNITGVWRLVDHARNSPNFLPFYGTDTGPALWLVGDAGIYLMSNGSPRMAHDGMHIPKGRECEHRSFTVHAAGCDPSVDGFEHWRKLHNAVEEGSDFCFTIDANSLPTILNQSKNEIAIVLNQDKISIHSDSEFQKVFGPALS